jgi:membrane protein DedA with SNARE-associated domain
MAAYLAGLLGWFGFAVLKFAISPSLMIGSGYNFWETWAVTSLAGIVGVTVFYFFGNGIFNWIDSKRRKKKKVFTKGSRRTVNFMGKYGLRGLALFSVVLSVPLAGLIAARYFRQPVQVLPVLYVAFTTWSFILTSASIFIAEFFNA